jgi:beta-1,4-mannosyl-glycoprotein beta-1,4-N-acetylglucosaminyltransferase
MLELRLAQMYPHVDYFVVLESAVTFTDKLKPLHVHDAWARFAPYHDKLIRRTLDTEALGFTAETGTWTRESGSCNALFSQVVPQLEGAQAAVDGDVLLVSDVDEIPKPATLAALRACDFPPRTALASHMYFYSFQWLSSEDWPRPHAAPYRGANNTVSPQDLRGGDGAKDGESFRMENAAWHCSYCFDSFRALANKVESFSHHELNKPEFKNPKAVLERVRLGKDFYDRSDRIYHYIEANHDVPDVVKENPQKYKHLLDRTPPNANFVDYDEFFSSKGAQAQASGGGKM